uniref:PKD-like domain-containing protein n=1 Tax=Marivirga sp. TaxID=2018662 RepID=UPI0025F58088
SGVTTASLTLTSISSTENGYQYRAVVSNGAASQCNAVASSTAATLTVINLPTADAGTNGETCSNSSYDLTESVPSVSNNAAILWSSAGDGTFSDNTILEPIYSPGINDISNGSVVLTLKATGNGTCNDTSDTMILSITAEPTAFAGANDEICVSSTYTVNDAVVNNSVGITWTHDGLGSLANANSLTPTYSPVTGDAGNIIILTLTVTGNGSCADAVDTKELIINDLPVANITTTATEVCEADPFTLAGTIGGGADNGEWQVKAGQGASIDAAGTLDATTVNNTASWEAIYTPNGSYFGDVIFEFVASGSATCPDDIKEHTLTIRSLPNVTYQSYSLCEDTAGNGISNVNLTDYNTEVTSEPQANVNIEWFTNSTLTNPVTDETSVNVSNGSTYYAKITFKSTNCFNVSEVDFIVNPLPMATALNKSYCENNVGDGQATVDLTQTHPEINNQTGNYTFEWFTTADLNPTNQIAVGDLSNYTIVDNDLLYVNVTNTDTGCENNTTVDFQILPLPDVDTPTDIIVCSFENVITNFTANLTGVTYSWNNDNTASGIPTSGTGNINVNADENLTSVDIVSTIQVTATKNGCVSSVKTFTVTVKPKPVINLQADLEICPGDAISSIALADDSGGASTITWTATNASAIGLPSSSGTGDIPAFTANTNNSTSPITSNITITSTWNGCVSDQENFEITLKPTPIMNAVADTELCAGDVYSVNFTNSLSTGTTYSWTNNNTDIGLAATGSGDISFTVPSNTTGSKIIAQITVTPTNNLCQGPAEVFTLTLNPTPVFTALPDVEYCSEDSVSIPILTDLTAVNFTLTVSDNSLFSSGPVLNGQNIEFTTAINTSGSDITSNITVNAEKDGCESNESFVVTLKNRPVVSAEADEPLLCAGDMVSNRTFTHDSGTGTFSWEITNPILIGDGSAASGTGDFPGFELAENITGGEIEGYVKYLSESNGCFSIADSFKITLKPSPVILNVDTTFCEGDFVNIEFLSNVNDAQIYYWTIDNLTIGINNSSGDTDQFITPAGFTAVNSSETNDNVANITVYSIVNGCQGPSKTFEVRVLPNATITNTNLEFTTCSNETFTFIPESNIASSNFEWSLISGDTSIIEGIELSGTGDIILDLINTSGDYQDIVYEITPLNDNCVGTSEEITISVAPEIQFETIENEYFVCSEQEFELPITLVNNLHLNDIEFEWTVSNNQSGAVDSTATVVGGNLTNSVSGQRDTVIYTITPKLLDGSCAGNSEVISVIINPNAIVEILPVEDICEGDNLTLEAQLINGAGSGQWSGGAGIFSSVTSPITTYIPNESEYGNNVTLRFTANDPDGSGPCTTSYDEVTFTINLLPNVAITGDPFPNDLYCIRNGIQELTGSPIGGVFSGRGVFEENGSYFFDPSVATVGGPYTITYEFTNDNGCVNSAETPVEVTNGPNSNFEVDTDDSDGFFCSNAFLELDPAQNGGNFSGLGIVIIGGITYFDGNSTEVEGLEEVDISYTIFEAETSCTAVTTKTLKRIPEPEITINYQNLCDVDNAVQIFINPGYNYEQDSLISFQLEYERSPNRIYEEGQIEQFSSAGVKDITIIGTTALGCVFETTTTINVGNIQKADFSVSNLKTSTSGAEPTQFTNQSVLDVLNGDPSINRIISYQWDFGVQGEDTDTSSLENPSYNYEIADAYDVRLIIESSLGCSDTITKTINIVPAIVSYPYFETFNESSGGWYTESIDNIESSWIYDYPNGAFEGKNDNPNPQKIWKTAAYPDSLPSGYREDENSFLVGPTFDLTDLKKPMIAFDMWLDVQSENFEGAILEYTTNGENWFVFGQVNDELNWYNINTSIPIGDEESNRLNYAWNFTNENRNWIRVAHIINDNLINDLSSVTFRINFKGDRYSGTPDGMAIDNIYVGERQKLVLIENFTNLNSDKYITNRTNVESLLSSTIGKDILPLNFHISIPEPDSINMRNSVEMDARASIYSIEESPKVVIDGELFNGDIFDSNDELSQEFQNRVTRRSLLEPTNLVDILIDESADENTIRFKATLSPNTDTTRNLIAYFFVVEDSVPQVDQLNNIVRKILPNINGIKLNSISETTNENYEWEVNSIYTNDDLAIATIVQDRNTNSIVEIKMVPVNQFKKPKKVLNIEKGFESLGLKLYPNPSRGNVNLVFNHELREDLQIFILDAKGALVKESKIEKGISKTELDLNGLASGVYHIITKNSEGKLNRKKLVILD